MAARADQSRQHPQLLSGLEDANDVRTTKTLKYCSQPAGSRCFTCSSARNQSSSLTFTTSWPQVMLDQTLESMMKDLKFIQSSVVMQEWQSSIYIRHCDALCPCKSAGNPDNSLSIQLKLSDASCWRWNIPVQIRAPKHDCPVIPSSCRKASTR
eukprot:758609-Hanusia_phi.AAC.1